MARTTRHGSARIVVSVVSHGHGDHLPRLLDSLERSRDILPIRVVLTSNLGEGLSVPSGHEDWIQVIENEQPKGFGANHNAAFRATDGDVFCVCNPDVHVGPDTFEPLLDALEDGAVGVAAPHVRNAGGQVQDSARRELTLARLARRVLSRGTWRDYDLDQAPAFEPDWVAGMFMAFRRDAYESVAGFDERYFLYCEDADICRRLRRSGRRVLFVPQARVVHDAQRDSHRRATYLYWHLKSIARYRFGKTASTPPAPTRTGASRHGARVRLGRVYDHERS